MDLSQPLSSIAPSLDADALTVLARTETPLTGRRVAALARRGSQPGIQAALDRLVSQGLVHAQPAGSAMLYTLNREHLLADAVVACVGARNTLLTRLSTHIDAWQTPAVHSSLFGSVARAQAATGSDIDVLIVRSDDVDESDDVWARQLADLEEQVMRWTGNTLSWFETTSGTLSTAVTAGEPMVKSWRDDAVHLTGTQLNRLLVQPSERVGS